jgi:alpha-ribazole phosphatase
MILVRHGQTEWNASQKYQGQTDVPLNALGRRQAGSIAAYLREHESPEALYASDLVRARETASIIGQQINLPVITDSRLRELNFGIWEGLTFSEVYRDYPTEFDDWFQNTLAFKVPGGESFQQLLNRSLQVLGEIAARHAGTVAVTTHGGVIMALLFHLHMADSLWQKGVEPGSLSYFDFSPEGIQAHQIGIKLSIGAE